MESNQREIPLLTSLILGALLLFQGVDNVSLTLEAEQAAIKGYYDSLMREAAPGGACVYGTRVLLDPSDKQSYRIIVERVRPAPNRIACRVQIPDDYLGMLVYLPGIAEDMARYWARLALKQEQDLGFPADVFIFWRGPNEDLEHQYVVAVGIYSSVDGSARGETTQPDTTRVWR